MSNELMVFDNHDIEVIEVDGQFLFDPKQISECIGLNFSTAKNHISTMSGKHVIKLTNSIIRKIESRTDGRILNNFCENFLTEAGVYKLLFKSNKPEAEKFFDWISDEVFPLIRKTEAYIFQESLNENKILNRKIKEIKALLSKADKCNDNLKKDYNDIVEEKKAQNDEIKKLNSIIKTQSSKIESCDKVIEKHKNRDDFAKDLSTKCLEKMQEYLNCNALKHVTAGRVFKR